LVALLPLFRPGPEYVWEQSLANTKGDH
jgi:hypothetical protein